MLSFGQAILLWRMERGLTQQQLAQHARIPRSNLSAVERGKQEVSLRTLRALADAMGIRPGVLADGLPPPQEGKPGRRLSRAAMERIADQVVSGETVERADDPWLIDTLRKLVAPRARAYHKSWHVPRWSRRKTNLAWLQLRTRYAPEAVESLLGRITDRLHRS